MQKNRSLTIRGLSRAHGSCPSAPGCVGAGCQSFDDDLETELERGVKIPLPGGCSFRYERKFARKNCAAPDRFCWVEAAKRTSDLVRDLSHREIRQQEIGLQRFVQVNPGLLESRQCALHGAEYGRMEHLRRLDQGDQPRIGETYLPQSPKAHAHSFAPVTISRGSSKFLHDALSNRSDEIVLSRDVIINRHRADPEPVRKRPHAERLNAMGLHEAARFGHDPFPRQAEPVTALWR